MTVAVSDHASRVLLSAYLFGLFGLMVVGLRGSDPAALRLTSWQWRTLTMAAMICAAVAAVALVVNGAWIVADGM